MSLEDDMRTIGPGVVEAANRIPARQPHPQRCETLEGGEL